MEAVKLGLILVAIIIALRRKVPVGLTLLAMGPFTALIYQVPPATLAEGYLDVTLSRELISLTGLVVFITIMGSLLKELGYLDRLATSCRGLYGDSRTAVAILPPLVGLMPMPGGSLLSAPLVNSVLSDERYTPHFKCAANYWFRHLVEFTWPIYAGIVLTEALTGMPIARVSLLQVPFTLAMIGIGMLVFIRRIKNEPAPNPSWLKPLLGIAGSIWPVAVAVLMYGILKLELSLSALIALVSLVLLARPSRKILVAAIRRGLSIKLLMLIFGVLTFQKVLELSGGIESIPKLATVYDLPPELVIFLVCFTIGLLTGIVSAYVGLGYSLLAGLLYQPELNPGYIMLASLSGFIGVILSPAHLCLILTNNYFGSDLFKVLKTLILPLSLLAVFGWLLYLAGYGDLFV